MLLKLQKYELNIKYTKGRDMHVADALSRALLNVSDENSEEIELAVHTLTNNLPQSERRKTEFKVATKSDHVLQQVHKLIMDGWPVNINNVPRAAREFWKVRDAVWLMIYCL